MIRSSTGVAERTSTALRGTLGRLTRLVRGLCIGAFIVGAATYVTLLWVTDGEDWVLLGAVICAAPLVAGLLAFWRLSSTLHVAPKALDDLRTVLRDRKATTAMGPLFDPRHATADRLVGPQHERHPRRGCARDERSSGAVLDRTGARYFNFSPFFPPPLFLPHAEHGMVPFFSLLACRIPPFC
jgi:hypothetical protein